MEGWHNLQWYDYMRMVTGVLALIGMWRCAMMFRMRRKKEKTDRRASDPRLDDFFWVVSAMLLTILIGSLEHISGGTGYRSAGVLSLMITLVTLRATRGRKKPIQSLNL